MTPDVPIWEVFNFKGSSGDFDSRMSRFAACGRLMDDLGFPDVEGKSQALLGFSKEVQASQEFFLRVSKDSTVWRSMTAVFTTFVLD